MVSENLDNLDEGCGATTAKSQKSHLVNQQMNRWSTCVFASPFLKTCFKKRYGLIWLGYTRKVFRVGGMTKSGPSPFYKGGSPQTCCYPCLFPGISQGAHWWKNKIKHFLFYNFLFIILFFQNIRATMKQQSKREGGAESKAPAPSPTPNPTNFINNV